jgi:hypothetical protein
MLCGPRVDRSLSESRDARQDLIGAFGPDKGFRIGLMRLDEFLDRPLQVRHAPERAAANLLVRQLGEPSLHEAQPGAIGWREMGVEPGTLGEPVLDERRLVGAVVVHDDVHVQRARYPRVNQIEKLTELSRSMSLMELRNHVTGLRIQRGEQRRGPVSFVRR